LEEIGNELSIEDNHGFPTGERAFLYQPKSFVIIGTLGEFLRDGSFSREKFGSFELFRRNMTNPEVITFDELLERARHVVKHVTSSSDMSDGTELSNHQELEPESSDVPFGENYVPDGEMPF